jgi:hypothetical protein
LSRPLIDMVDVEFVDGKCVVNVDSNKTIVIYSNGKREEGKYDGNSVGDGLLYKADYFGEICNSSYNGKGTLVTIFGDKYHG